MPELTVTMKLHIHTDAAGDRLFREFTERYASACTYASRYVFDHGFPLNYMVLHNAMYHEVRSAFDLKSQMTQSVFKTVAARYKAVKEQLYQNPYRYQDEKSDWCYITKTLEWLTKPIVFHRHQADLVRNRDYSFVDGGRAISINTLEKRVRATFDVPDNFKQYFDGTWSFGTGKLVSLKGRWYLHIPMTREAPDSGAGTKPSHVVGIDRGLRFIANTYDETGKSCFFSGKDIIHKRNKFAEVRAELQAKGTKSAKHKLKTISGRENRWMVDVNHQLSKALVDMYGSNTLYVLEDLTGVSFDEKNLSNKAKLQRNQIRLWAFYQFEQFLTYKAARTGSEVIKVWPDYTSQRCPKCGRINKDNRHHDIHEYVCDSCGYRSNDDRVGAMNIYELGTMYVSGDSNPGFGARKTS